MCQAFPGLLPSSSIMAQPRKKQYLWVKPKLQYSFYNTYLFEKEERIVEGQSKVQINVLHTCGSRSVTGCHRNLDCCLNWGLIKLVGPKSDV